MIGFGENNEEFGRYAPALITCEEIPNDEGYADNALSIKIETDSGIFQIVFPDYYMHFTRKELYTPVYTNEPSKGRYLKIFEKSFFTDLFDQAMAHADSQTGTHYEIVTDFHVIDIFSDSEPIITQIQSEES